MENETQEYRPAYIDWLALPDWANWSAEDENGEVWLYELKPENEGGEHFFTPPGFRGHWDKALAFLDRKYLHSDWRKSAYQIKKQ